MPRERFDELLPFVPVLRRRNVLLVPERMQRVRIGSELLGHETQFDEGANFIFQEAIVNLVDIGKVCRWACRLCPRRRSRLRRGKWRENGTYSKPVMRLVSRRSWR